LNSQRHNIVLENDKPLVDTAPTRTTFTLPENVDEILEVLAASKGYSEKDVLDCHVLNFSDRQREDEFLSRLPALLLTPQSECLKRSARVLTKRTLQTIENLKLRCDLSRNNVLTAVIKDLAQTEKRQLLERRKLIEETLQSLEYELARHEAEFSGIKSRLHTAYPRLLRVHAADFYEEDIAFLEDELVNVKDWLSVMNLWPFTLKHLELSDDDLKALADF
jgi:anion-transporting  ArsA/GET3 family ATPase